MTHRPAPSPTPRAPLSAAAAAALLLALLPPLTGCPSGGDGPPADPAAVV